MVQILTHIYSLNMYSSIDNTLHYMRLDKDDQAIDDLLTGVAQLHD